MIVLRHRLLIALAVAAMDGMAYAGCPPQAADGTMIRKGELMLAWRPVVKAEPDAKPTRIPMAKHFALEVQLCGKDGASNLQLGKADATMPDHRHGMNYRPVIKPLGDGRFRVEGMMFHMAGRWELAFELHTGKEVTRLTHDVQVD